MKYCGIAAVFASQGRQYILIKAAFGKEEYTVGTLILQILPSSNVSGYRNPQVSKFAEKHCDFLSIFRPTRATV